MSKTNNGGPAFPVADLAWLEPKNTDEAVRAASGMTLRDYFAAKAMQGMWASDSEGWHCSGSPDALASRAADAYAMADAMLKARGEEK